MVSEFQKKLDDFPDIAEADFCHETKEFLDAIEYLWDDLAQADLARDRSASLGNLPPLEISEARRDLTDGLKKTVDAAKRMLEWGHCPSQKGE